MLNCEQIRDNPHARIYRAGLKGTGLKLSAEEVQRLMMDDAIVNAAISWMDDNGYVYLAGNIVKA